MDSISPKEYFLSLINGKKLKLRLVLLIRVFNVRLRSRPFTKSSIERGTTFSQPSVGLGGFAKNNPQTSMLFTSSKSAQIQIWVIF
jgi:hypothetical protein